MKTVHAGNEPQVPPQNIRDVVLTGHDLTVAELVAVARHRARVRLAPAARERIARCRLVVEALVEARATVYGLTTGFGSKRDVPIDFADALTLQRNLIRSHACGVGQPLAEDIVRAAMLLRANTLSLGVSGVRLEVVERLIEFLNRDVYPFVPEKGSVGASGDLAPLSHLVLVLIGDPAGLVYETQAAPTPGECGERLGQYVARPERRRFVPATAETLARFGVAPLQLSYKEGLALNNGTQIIVSIGALTAYDAANLLASAELALALSLEAAKGVPAAYDPRLHGVRPLPGQAAVAEHVRRFTADSEILAYTLNTAHVQAAERALGELASTLNDHAARAALDDEGRALRLEMLAAHVARVAARLDPLAEDPLGARGAALDAADAAAARPQTGRERDSAAFRRALMPVQQEMALLYRELAMLATVLPEDDIGKPRALLGRALHALEAAVPVIPSVQDDYSLRCAPQVLGSTLRALEHAVDVLTVDMNAATDNPLIFPPPAPPELEADPPRYRAFLQAHIDWCKDGVLSGGNFHGEPGGMVLDYLAIGLAELANIAERRVALLVDGARSNGLPSLLVSKSGLNSGFMIPQYTAAALVSENKVLAHPATVDSIPTAENVEDHVSMGTFAARKCREVLRNAERVVAIELITAYQGLTFRRPLRPGVASRALQALFAAHDFEPLDEDRVLYPLIELATRLIRDESVAQIARQFAPA